MVGDRRIGSTAPPQARYRFMNLPTDADLNATIARVFGTSRPSQPVGTTMILPTVAPHTTERPVKVKPPCGWCTKKGAPCAKHGGPRRPRGQTMSTEERGRRSAATRIGVPFEEYERRRIFERWCTGCRAWHPLKDFGSDKFRPGGVQSCCRASKNALQRRTRKPVVRRPYVRKSAEACGVCRK